MFLLYVQRQSSTPIEVRQNYHSSLEKPPYYIYLELTRICFPRWHLCLCLLVHSRFTHQHRPKIDPSCILHAYSFTFLIAYSKSELKSNDDKASPSI
jgi:hypothetical protein